MVRIILVAVAILTIQGCAATPTAAATKVHDADAAEVASCRYVGDVDGSSSWGNVVADAGLENAKNAARDQAATKLGATHIVWNTITGGMAPSVTGKAYKC